MAQAEVIVFKDILRRTGLAYTFYVGTAPCGTATSAAAWKIRQVYRAFGTEDDCGSHWADGNTLYDNIMDNANSLSYS